MKTSPEQSTPKIGDSRDELDIIVEKIMGSRPIAKEAAAAVASLASLLAGYCSEKEQLDREIQDAGSIEAVNVKFLQRRTLMDRIELHPACVARCNKHLEQMESELSSLIAEGCLALRAEARKRLKALIGNLDPRVREMCGGNLSRSKVVLDAIDQNCEARRWLTAASWGQIPGQTPDARAEKFLKVCEGFKKGSSASEAFAS